MKNILFLPIDNRPITYSLTKQITDVNKSLKLNLPDRKLLGGLVDSADINELLKWLESSSEADLIILSLDTIAYGGLVPSRRSTETFDDIKKRLDYLKEILIFKKRKNKNLKIFATSSIMRISNNNVNEEEKEYWNVWGKRIFSYSYHQHKSRVLKEYNCVYNIIPNDILEDYLDTRKRNFEINRYYLDFLSDNVFDFVVFSKDDTGEFGLNVEEAQKLEEEIKSRNLNAIVKTGADEIPLGLLLKGAAGDTELKIKIVYSNPLSVNQISRYEDISVSNCVLSQIKIGLDKAEIVDENENITFFVNNFQNVQGDLVFLDVINNFNKTLPVFNSPYIYADINNANGSDNLFVNEIFKKGFEPDFLSYSGYNTSANTIGSALCMGIISYFAKKEGVFDAEASKKLLATRFLDDYAYQANIRKKIQNIEDKNYKKALIDNLEDFKFYENEIKNFLNTNFNASYSLPWDRSFEIEIDIETET